MSSMFVLPSSYHIPSFFKGHTPTKKRNMGFFHVRSPIIIPIHVTLWSAQCPMNFPALLSLEFPAPGPFASHFPPPSRRASPRSRCRWWRQSPSRRPRWTAPPVLRADETKNERNGPGEAGDRWDPWDMLGPMKKGSWCGLIWFYMVWYRLIWNLVNLVTKTLSFLALVGECIIPDGKCNTNYRGSEIRDI